ncbi:hypothetical protein V8F06_011188 [Rhypophila decipiens]
MRTPSPANPQSQSLVTRLPREIRDQIYLDLWQSPDHGLRQHIFRCMSADGRKERLCRRPCTRPESDEQASEMSRCFGHSHSDCATEVERKGISKNARPNGRTRARIRARTEARTTSWLPLLLVCKGISAEVLKSIYESTTFIFADIVAFVKFPAPPLDQITNI